MELEMIRAGYYRGEGTMRAGNTPVDVEVLQYSEEYPRGFAGKWGVQITEAGTGTPVIGPGDFEPVRTKRDAMIAVEHAVMSMYKHERWGWCA